MRFRGIDPERLLKIVPEQLASGASGFDRRVEVVRHEERLIGLGPRAAK